jgi:drug/metabolite transporter (DMT)-like permease
MAALFMLGWCRWEGAEFSLRPYQWRPIVVTSLMLFVQIVTFNWGVAKSNSSHASLFINTFLFWVAGIDHFVLRTHRLSAQQFVGLALAGGAALLVLLEGHPVNPASQRELPTLAGDLLLLVSAVVLAVKFVYTKVVVATTEPGKLMFWHDVLGTLLFFAWSAAFEETDWHKVNQPTIWGLVYQGLVVAGFCFALQAWQLRRHTASQIAVFSAATPLFGILFGALFRNDPLSPWLVVAGLAVAVGIWLVSRPA